MSVFFLLERISNKNQLLQHTFLIYILKYKYKINV